MPNVTLHNMPLDCRKRRAIAVLRRRSQNREDIAARRQAIVLLPPTYRVGRFCAYRTRHSIAETNRGTVTFAMQAAERERRYEAVCARLARSKRVS